MRYLFKDAKNTMVITTKEILNGEHPVTTVFHDLDDGMWQFLDGEELSEERAAIISLEEMAEIDDSVNDIADLPLGGIARKKDGVWIE
ncbi:MAG: hypothetical protein K2N31_10615 [Treponemataceae bacterium]|nr:hypothetical protein [Treponemataceae bacterium]